MHNSVEITTEEQGKAIVVNLKGKIDTVSAQKFDEFLDKDIQDAGNNYIFSLAGLEYISSSGLRSFIRIGKRISQASGSLVLCGAHGIVQEVFQISGFHKLFTMVDSMQEALEATGYNPIR